MGTLKNEMISFLVPDPFQIFHFEDSLKVKRPHIHCLKRFQWAPNQWSVFKPFEGVIQKLFKMILKRWKLNKSLKIAFQILHCETTYQKQKERRREKQEKVRGLSARND